METEPPPYDSRYCVLPPQKRGTGDQSSIRRLAGMDLPHRGDKEVLIGTSMGMKLDWNAGIGGLLFGISFFLAPPLAWSGHGLGSGDGDGTGTIRFAEEPLEKIPMRGELQRIFTQTGVFRPTL